MKRVLWLLGMVVAAAVVAIVIAAGARKPSPTPPPPTPLPTDLAAARDTVINYLTLLDQGEYTRAFALLTSDSIAHRTLEQFTAAAKAGKTEFSEDKVRVERVDPAHALVTVPLFEDPAEHGFRLVLSYGEWRIEMHGGTPYAPEGPP